MGRTNNFILKIILLSVALTSVTFAAWEASAVAIGLSTVLLALIYMIGTGFNVTELKVVAKEEGFQLIATCVMIMLLLGSGSILNYISTSADLLHPGTTTIQDSALASINDSYSNTTNVLTNIATYDQALAKQSSQNLNCNIGMGGYTISTCGGFGVISAPLAMAGSITAFALSELAGMAKLLELTPLFSLLILPLGILLRTFKFSRGAGGLLIAVSIAIQILLPFGILFGDMLADTFTSAGTSGISPATTYGYTFGISNTAMANAEINSDTWTCDPSDTSTGSQDSWNSIYASGINISAYQPATYDSSGNLVVPYSQYPGGTNEQKAIAVYMELRSELRGALYLILIKATMESIIAILMVMGGIRAISSLAGADVDVSILGRFA